MGDFQFTVEIVLSFFFTSISGNIHIFPILAGKTFFRQKIKFLTIRIAKKENPRLRASRKILIRKPRFKFLQLHFKASLNWIDIAFN